MQFNHTLLFLLVLAAMAVFAPASVAEDTELAYATLLHEAPTVTASRQPVSALESPANITVVTRDQIMMMGLRTIPEVLGVVPGFNPWRSSAGDWWPGPRGVFDANRSFVVMIDGVSINNQVLGTPYWTYDLLDITRFDRIEIVRGPASALYGSNAYLAVINCITPDASRHGGALDLTVESNNGRGIRLTHAFKQGPTQFDFGTSGYSSNGESRWLTGDADNRGGFTRNQQVRRDSSLAIKDERGLTLYAQHVEGNRGGYMGYYAILNDDTYYRRTNDLLAVKYTRHLRNRDELELGFSFNRFYDRETAQSINPGITWWNGVTYPVGATEEDVLKDETMTFSLQWTQPANRRHRLNARIEITSLNLTESALYASFAHPEDPSQWDFIPGALPTPERFWDHSLSIQDDIRLDQRTRLVLGLRCDRHSLFGSTTSPRVGLIRRIDRRWTAKFLYGEAFRHPDFHEITRDRTLSGERIRTSEVQLLGALAHDLSVKLSMFYNVLLDRLASGYSIEDYRNVGRSEYDGLELELKKRFGAQHEAWANLSTFRLRHEDLTPFLAPGVPHNRLNVGYSLHVNDWDATVWHTLTSDQPRNSADARDPTPGWQLTHLTLQKKKAFGSSGRIAVSVHNLFNRTFSFVSSPGTSLDNLDYTQEGRVVTTEMSWEF